ncbi:MAG TPA: methyltransferase domain-containing protein [Kineosporiaceae bacterium]|nr:methyltransferase domain-containing protein [Kineosporiaceae bacterium]
MGNTARAAQTVGELIAKGLAGLRQPGTLPERVRGRVRRELKARHPPENACIACLSGSTWIKTIKRPKRSFRLRICKRCGYVSNYTNTVDYTQFTSVDRFELTARVGSKDRAGREFYMAKMGVEILDRGGLRVNVFGAGRSLDYLHIRELPGVQRAIISDVVDLGLDEDFVNVANGTSERFDLIIACEVIEHFTDPSTEFPRLFNLLTKDGLLVCSTNIYDGGDLAKQEYLYRRGHVSYYTPRTIAEIAHRNRIHFDFRVPQMATTQGGPRKRYVLLSRSRKVMESAAIYFGDHMYAPSEDPKIALERPVLNGTPEVVAPGDVHNGVEGSP